MITASPLTVRDVLASAFAGFERRLRAMARDHGDARRLMTTRYQSGETDRSGRISKMGDAGVRTALYEAAKSS